MGEFAALDGGWGWMVVLASCMNNFLIVGLARTVGVLFNEIMVYFNTTATVVAFVTGVNSGIRMFGGPLASYFFLRLDGRLVVMMGGLLVALSYVVSAFAPNPYLLLVTYSAVGGIGGCFVFTPSYVIINQYFDKRRGKALGLGTLGAGLGSIALAPLNAFLLDQYGYRGAMGIIGAIMLNCCVAGALYRPIGNNYPRREKGNSPVVNETQELTNMNDSIKHDIRDVQEYEDIEADVQEDSKDGCKARFEICTHGSFVIYCLQLMAMPLCVSNYLLWLPKYAVDLGQTATMGALLLSVAGVSDIVGRLVGGAIFDIRFIRDNKRLCHTLVSLAMASCVIATGLVRSYWAVMGLVVCHGLTEGTFHSQRTSIASHVVPQHLMPHSVGFMIFSQGGGVFLGPIMGGVIVDMTGSCHWNFILNGGLFGLFSFFFLMDFFCRTRPTKDL